MLGYDARYARTEQFSHMELFSACRGDTVLVLEAPDERTHGLVGALKDAGINAVIPDSMLGTTRATGGSDASEFLHAMYCAFLVQALALGMADKRGLQECHFVRARDMRRASDAAIC